MNENQTKAELRIIEKSLQREEMVESLKQKHNITGTVQQQKAKLQEKREEISHEDEQTEIE